MAAITDKNLRDRMMKKTLELKKAIELIKQKAKHIWEEK